jgi:serine/threonine-protein kinase
MRRETLDRRMSDADAQVKPGEVLAGKYRVDRVLGRGGMGIVVAAHHVQLDEKVAIKFLLPGALGNADAVARFIREARAAVKIKSEHVARVSDVGTLETGAPYMVMEYLEGSDLGAWLDERGPMAVDQAAEFVLHASEALAEAHALGIVHRDLKPANLFCVRRADGLLSVKVLDFGISKVSPVAGSSHDHAMTRTHAILGSPLYMSPEQMVSSRGVDARTDIWSLGVILYQLVTGRTPFEAEAMPELVLKIAGSPPTPIATFRPDVPPPFGAVISRCLEKDRDKRFRTIGELAEALVDFAPPRARGSVERVMRTMEAAGLATPGASSPLQPAPGAANAVTAPGGPTLDAWGRTGTGGSPAPSTSGKRLALAAAAAAVLAAVAGGVVLSSRGRAHPGRPQALETEAMPRAASVPAPVAVPMVPPTSTPVAEPATPAARASETEGATTAAPSHARRPRAASGASPAPANPAPVPAAAPARNCNPPYVIDLAGHRQYKPECL